VNFSRSFQYYDGAPLILQALHIVLTRRIPILSGALIVCDFEANFFNGTSFIQTLNSAIEYRKPKAVLFFLPSQEFASCIPSL